MPHKKQKTILVSRFSAMGDVAMTVPVLRELIAQNPEIQIVFVSRKKFEPMFENLPQITFHAADLDHKHKGIFGIWKLARELQRYKIDAYADLHNVIRTKILRIFLSSRIKSETLDKGREERKELLRAEGNQRKPLKHMTERYADVFRNLGFTLKLSHQLPTNPLTPQNAIGIAPFAMYEGKMYPIDKMRSVALKIAENGTTVYLFGGGKTEKQILESWENLHPNIQSTVGKLTLTGELDLIRKIKLMVSMDSANMHLASLVGTPVISIWGNTHPYMGFLGYGQKMENVIQDETFVERPTSVFGKEKNNALRTDFFQNISPEVIIKKIESHLKSV